MTDKILPLVDLIAMVSKQQDTLFQAVNVKTDEAGKRGKRDRHVG